MWVPLGQCAQLDHCCLATAYFSFFFPSFFFYLPDFLLAQSNSTLWLSVSKKKKKGGWVGDLKSFWVLYTPAISEGFGEWLLISPRVLPVLQARLLSCVVKSITPTVGGEGELWHGNMSSDNCRSILFHRRHTVYMGQSYKLLLIIGVRSLFFSGTWTHRRHWHGGNINGATPFLIPCDYDFFFFPFTPELLIPLSAPSRLSCLKRIRKPRSRKKRGGEKKIPHSEFFFLSLTLLLLRYYSLACLYLSLFCQFLCFCTNIWATHTYTHARACKVAELLREEWKWI